MRADLDRDRSSRPPSAMVGLVAVLALVLVALVVAVGRARAAPQPPPLLEPVPVPAVDRPADVLVVHVAGAVRNPGLVEVADGARVADAVAAAGGATTVANLTALNLAAPLRDGDQLVVPVHGALGASQIALGDGRIDLNRASATELSGLPGVGPVLAERIVSHREAHGRFETVEDLLDVPGIGEGKLAALRDLAAVG